MGKGDVVNYDASNNKDVWIKDKNGNQQRADLMRDIAMTSAPSDLIANLQKIDGITPITILADRSDISTTELTMWPVPTQTRYTAKDTGATISLVSSSANDAWPSGTGVREVLVGVIYGDYTPGVRTVRLNGITPVTVDSDGVSLDNILAVNYMNPGENVDSVGTTNTSQGNIDALYGTDVLARIQQSTVKTYNITRQCVFTVPEGFDFYVYDLHASSGSGEQVKVNLYARIQETGVYVLQHEILLYQDEVSAPLEKSWIKYPEKRLLEVTAEADLGVNRSVSVAVSGVLVIRDLVDNGNYSV